MYWIVTDVGNGRHGFDLFTDAGVRVATCGHTHGYATYADAADAASRLAATLAPRHSSREEEALDLLFTTTPRD